MTSESYKKANANSLIKKMRRGFLILKADKNYPNNPSLYEIIDINSSVKDLMGKQNVNLVGRKIADIIPLKKSDLDMLAHVMNPGNSEQFEYSIKRLGEWLLISIHQKKRKS